jgi:uncharacterized protein YcbX
MAVIHDLYFYPIKSFRGVRTNTLPLLKNGPAYDRQWMLVDEKNQFITQRTMPKLAKIGLQFDSDVAIELSLPGFDTIDFGLEEHENKELKVNVWKTEMPAFEVSGEVSDWLSGALDKKVKLVTLAGEARRPFSPEFEDRDVRFVDSQPLLVCSIASLKLLESKAGISISMSRFRPNIVVDKVEAHAEDNWPGFKVGNVSFKAMKPCTRCTVTTVHPLTGEKGEEPLKTLSTYRKTEGGITFGHYYAHLGEGRISIGDTLLV